MVVGSGEGDNVVAFNTLLRGLQAAYERVLETRKSQSPDDMFIPVFEALNWATIIGFREEWHSLDSDLGELYKALKYVRNRVHHQWAVAIYWSEGAVFPIKFPSPWHEWLWRSRSDLPLADPNHKPQVGEETAYDQRLDQRSVWQTLNELLEKLGGTP